MIAVEWLATHHHFFSISKVNKRWISSLAETKKNRSERKVAVVHGHFVTSKAETEEKVATRNVLKMSSSFVCKEN